MKNLNEIKEIYLKERQVDGISEKELNDIEKNLSIVFPTDFRCISRYFSGGDIGPINVYDFIGSDINIVSETLRLRAAIQLPNQYIVLAEPPESLVIMDTKNKPSIIWCDSNDAVNIKNSKFLSYPNKWDSYSDFFYDMITDMMEYR